MTKAVVILDYPRVEHVRGNKLDYASTALGRRFTQELRRAGLSKVVYLYLYPVIPEAKKTSRQGKILAYKSPAKKQINEHIDLLQQKVKEESPDLLIPVGTLSSTELVGKKIVSAQGVPVHIHKNYYDGYVLPMFSQEYVESKPTIKINRDLTMGLLTQYINVGEKAFKPERPHYFEVLDFDTVKKVFAKPIETGEFSWDTETNTLYPNRSGSKFLYLSFAWKEGHSCAIPLEHCERYSDTGKTFLGDTSIWTREQLDSIYAMFRNLLKARTVGEIKTDIKVDNPLPSSTVLSKVGHNITYDEHFAIATNHAHIFNNVMDSLVGYFLEVSQESETSRKLSDLAFTMTPLGGYDKPLEEYKTWFTEQVGYIYKKAKKDKETISDDYIIANLDYQYLINYNFNTDRIISWVVKVLKKVISRFGNSPKATMNLYDIETSNLFNGDKFSYEWIPSEIMYYYAAGDADACLRLHHNLLAMMKRDPLNADGRLIGLYTNFYPQLTATLANIQNNGMHVDDDYLTELTKVYKDEGERLKEKVREHPIVKEFEEERLSKYEIGVKELAKPVKKRNKAFVAYRNKYKDGKYKFDPSSAKDKQELFFKKLGYKLPYDKAFITKGVWESGKKEKDLTWKDYATGKNTIAELLRLANSSGNKELQSLMQAFSTYSVVSKIGSSFTDNMRTYIADTDGCLHGRFSASGTQTSRLSSSKINLQNIPAAKSNVHLFNYMHPVKRTFNSRFKGGRLLNIDYSSLEFHILALITKEDNMTNAFLNGEDIHKANAALMEGITIDDVTKSQRQASKAIGLTN